MGFVYTNAILFTGLVLASLVGTVMYYAGEEGLAADPPRNPSAAKAPPLTKSHPSTVTPDIVLPKYQDKTAPHAPPPTRAEVVRPGDPRMEIHGRYLQNGDEIVSDWSGTRVFLEFSGTRHVWADLSPANLSRSYSQNESYWCPHYETLYEKLDAANSPSQCPFWYDVWEAYIDGEHSGTVYLNITQEQIKEKPALAIRNIGSGLDPKLRHTLMLHKRTGPKKGGSIFRGIVLEESATAHKYTPRNLISGRRIEILGASEENGECALGHHKDFYATNLETSMVSYGTLLGEYFGAAVNFVSYGSAGIVLASADHPESAPYIDYYTRTLYGSPNHLWNFSAFNSSLVLIANGITDWGSVKDPSALLPTFARRFAEILEFVRDKYPEAWIVLVPWKQIQIEGISAGLALYQARKKENENDRKILMQILEQSKWPAEYRGCQNHPGPLGHRDYARQLAPTIENLLGWKPFRKTRDLGYL